MEIAIITGASSGIGRSFAKQLHQSGEVDEFWFVARGKTALDATASDLGINAKIITADLSTPAGLASIKDALAQYTPTVQYLIHSAGRGDFGAFDELTEEQISTTIDLNVKATVLLTKMTVPYMPHGGRIITLGSGSCFTPLPYFNTYSSSKVFVLHYTKSLNFELEKYGIRATCFCPGRVDTPLLDGLMNTPNRHPKQFKPKLNVDMVVKKCLAASKKGKTMCVVNWYTKLQHVLFKLVPDRLLTKTWLNMLTE